PAGDPNPGRLPQVRAASTLGLPRRSRHLAASDTSATPGDDERIANLNAVPRAHAWVARGAATLPTALTPVDDVHVLLAERDARDALLAAAIDTEQAVV